MEHMSTSQAAIGRSEKVQAPSPLALRPREAAAALGIGTRKLWEITADQTSGIPHARFGRSVLYPVRELADWLTRQTQREGAR